MFILKAEQLDTTFLHTQHIFQIPQTAMAVNGSQDQETRDLSKTNGSGGRAVNGDVSQNEEMQYLNLIRKIIDTGI